MFQDFLTPSLPMRVDKSLSRMWIYKYIFIMAISSAWADDPKIKLVLVLLM